MNSKIFDTLQTALAAERLDAYRQDQADSVETLARYLWNMAICESFYPSLQMVEIALRNALQQSLEIHFKSAHWFDDSACRKLLAPAQQIQIDDAKQNLERHNKPLAPGRLVAELTFGFWTAFFNKRLAQSRDAIRLTSQAFRAAPKSQRDNRSLNRRLTRIRELRNRVFHHERIIHWTDLDSRHSEILETIGWISPELKDLATVLDRFPSTRTSGIAPWQEKLRQKFSEGVSPSAEDAKN